MPKIISRVKFTHNKDINEKKTSTLKKNCWNAVVIIPEKAKQ